MSGVKVTTVLEGFDRLSRELKLANPETRSRVQRVVSTNTKTILAASEARVPRRSGELAATGRDEYANDGLVGMVKFGYGTLERRSRAGTERGKRRFEKVRGRRDVNRLHLALAASSRQALSVADLGVYAPVPDRGDRRRHIRAQHFLSAPFAAQKPAIITGVSHALNDTVEQIAGGTP